MRKLLFALPMALLLTACETEDINKITVDVIARTTQVCGFVPTAVTVAEIFGQTQIKVAADIATAICNAVTNVKPGAGVGTSTPPTVQSVVVRGTFVK